MKSGGEPRVSAARGGPTLEEGLAHRIAETTGVKAGAADARGCTAERPPTVSPTASSASTVRRIAIRASCRVGSPPCRARASCGGSIQTCLFLSLPFHPGTAPEHVVRSHDTGPVRRISRSPKSRSPRGRPSAGPTSTRASYRFTRGIRAASGKAQRRQCSSRRAGCSRRSPAAHPPSLGRRSWRGRQRSSSRRRAVSRCRCC